MENPAHSTGLAPGDYNLFPVLKQNLGDLRFQDDHEVDVDTRADINREHKDSFRNTTNVTRTTRKRVAWRYN